MYQSLNNLPLTVFGEGLQRRAFSYIDDILECLWIAGQDNSTNGEIINLGGIESISIMEAC